MNRIKLFVAIGCLSLMVSGCKKEGANNNCEDLKDAIVINAKDDIKSIITSFINRLPSRTYNAENMNALVSSLSDKCAVSASLLCFDCVATYPSMSEIQITLPSTQPATSVVVDISYTTDNKMRCAYVHD